MASTNRLHVGDRAASLHTESCGTTKAGCDVVPRELSKGALVALSRIDWVPRQLMPGSNPGCLSRAKIEMVENRMNSIAPALKLQSERESKRRATRTV